MKAIALLIGMEEGNKQRRFNLGYIISSSSRAINFFCIIIKVLQNVGMI